jgi:hypothetical protein
MAIHDTIIERHLCTSEWAVSNLLPSKGAGSRIPLDVRLQLYSNGKMCPVGSFWVCGEREAYMCLYNTVGVAGHMPVWAVLRQSFAFFKLKRKSKTFAQTWGAP